jgi:DNA-binding LacI/PurR family transcriptional regulator
MHIKSLVREGIVCGRFKPNDRLPADYELAKQYSTSRLTVHRALRELADEGLLHREPRKGTIVSDPQNHIVGTVAFFVPEELSARAAVLVSSLTESLLKEGISVVPYTCHTVARAVQRANLLVRNPVLGAILTPPTYKDSLEIVEVFRQGGIPVIVEGKFDIPGEKISYVSTNHRQGGRILAEHLLKVGHRRFAVITAAHTQDVAERIEGFREGLSSANVTIERDGIFEVRYVSEVPYVVRELMSRPNRPTAIFGINDYMAMETMMALTDLGYKVPDDCAVVGMGNEPMSKALLSPLTTVQAPLEEEGRLLASAMLNTIAGRLNESQKIELDYELVVRKSCGVQIMKQV